MNLEQQCFTKDILSQLKDERKRAAPIEEMIVMCMIQLFCI
jgi:hypothetical protein